MPAWKPPMPLRQTVRAEVQSAIQQSPEARQARNAICQFWIEHQLPGKDNDITPYLSLALDLGPAPAFAPTLSEADLAPDAARVLGVISLLQKFYRAAGIQALWQKHQAAISGAGQSASRSGFPGAYPDRSLSEGAFQQLSGAEICGLPGAAALSGAGGFEKLRQQLLHGGLARPRGARALSGDAAYIPPFCA